MSGHTYCRDWSGWTWSAWAIDRGTVIGALDFCYTLDGLGASV